MKSKIKFPLILSLVLLCMVSACFIPFEDEEEDFEPHISTEPRKKIRNGKKKTCTFSIASNANTD